MKAAVLRDFSRGLEIENLSVDKPKAHEVLVRVAASGLCHSDLHILGGDIPFPLPTILGHEVSGIVEQVGTEVRTVKPGDHVVVSFTFHCGHCAECHTGHAYRCAPPEQLRGAQEPPRLSDGAAGLGQFCSIGGFAEQVLVHESGCIPINRDMPLDRACLLACGVSTGFGAAANTAGVRPGETVAVIGCGGVGLPAISGAFSCGAGRVIAVDRIAGKLDLARRFGATDTVDASSGDVIEQVMALTGGRGVDHAIECIGRPSTMEQAFAMLARGGTATICGAGSPGEHISIPSLSFIREKKIQGSLLGSIRPSVDIPSFVELYLQGRLPLDELISQRLSLAEINKGFDDLRSGEVARSIIVFDH
ncbi:Zn-dependent alcohol dehydrogenase [Novosphingobium pentaromativorans]|uniref:Alcohol dehydrogenase zinc-binding domain protein n=1 Tax=Novosphingobium pentaromativorans US6-1 TaxID=1088721 RepID=G6EGD0_9SPHN|nr:zinc-binding dehydrogenase [Novosphingobium pentaromativorans]AIT82190.1 alcohol dehydrogenase [Novosphingobium pentaromativorans US6-1]EHJ59819.1 Alcohol dehydrogenase zinc-binding domain protein [Novosphingobium pentaromativorans US6-1]